MKRSRRQSLLEGRGSASSATTTTVQGDQPHVVPRMPHERDESADSQAPGEPGSEHLGRIAHADAQRGLPDTTRGAETDAAYHQLREAAAPAKGAPPAPRIRRAAPPASRR